MYLREITEIAMKAGEILLSSGAEIYRVEDTITRICRCYGVDCESFVLPTGIFITTTGSDHDSISVTKRIKVRLVDLQRIELVNTFSRSLQKDRMCYEEAIKTLESICSTQVYKYPVRLGAAGISAFAFTLLFNGSFNDAIVAFLISVFIYNIKEKIYSIGFFLFFEYFVSGIIAGAASLAASAIIPELGIYRIIIGSIIILLPGVAITNGIKDALYGDIVSSLSRLGEAVFTVAAVGAGVGIVLSIGLRWV